MAIPWTAIATFLGMAGSALLNRNTAQQQMQASAEMSEEQRQYLEEQNRRELERQYNQAMAAQPFIDQMGGINFGDTRAAGRRAEAFGLERGAAIEQEGRAVSDQLMALLPQIQASDTSGLAMQARRQSRGAAAATQAALASRGLYTSGAGMRAEREVQSDIFGQLASAINQDQLQRAQAAATLTGQAGQARLGSMQTRADLGLRGTGMATDAFTAADTGQANVLQSIGQLISLLPGMGVTEEMFTPPPKPAPEETPTPTTPPSGGSSSSSKPNNKKRPSEILRDRVEKNKNKNKDKPSSGKSSPKPAPGPGEVYAANPTEPGETYAYEPPQADNKPGVAVPGSSNLTNKDGPMAGSMTQ